MRLAKPPATMAPLKLTQPYRPANVQRQFNVAPIRESGQVLFRCSGWHPERSEGSSAKRAAKSFAPLRMTRLAATVERNSL